MARPINVVAARRKIRCFEAVRSDTDGGENVWCSRLGKYVKPYGDIGGVTCENCCYRTPQARYEVEPIGLGSIDGY